MVDDIQNIYTIGYTLFHTTNGVNIDSMFDTLRKYHITHLVDVRSVPYSKQYPQCNADALKMCGKRYNIPYIHIPELGAKSSSEQDVFSKASDIFLLTFFQYQKAIDPRKPSCKPVMKLSISKSLELMNTFLMDSKELKWHMTKDLQ